MHRRTLLLAFFSGVASAPVTTTAQPARKVYRIGLLGRYPPTAREASAKRSNGHRYFLNLGSNRHFMRSCLLRCIREPSFFLRLPRQRGPDVATRHWDIQAVSLHAASTCLHSKSYGTGFCRISWLGIVRTSGRG